MSDDREAFEAWAKKKGLTLDSEKGLYRNFYTAIAWTAWQAAQAAMPVPRIQELMSQQKMTALINDWHNGNDDLRRLIRAVEAVCGNGGKS